MSEFINTADGRLIPTSRIVEIAVNRNGGALHTAKLENGEYAKLFDLPIAGSVIPNAHHNLRLKCCAGSVGDGWEEPILGWRFDGDLIPEAIGFSNNVQGVTAVVFDTETGIARDEDLGLLPIDEWLAVQREFAQKRAA